jgi:hypothetical protein
VGHAETEKLNDQPSPLNWWTLCLLPLAGDCPARYWAASRYGATTPKLLRWFKRFNQNRLYRDQVKPFNFLVAFQSRPELAMSEAEECAIEKKRPQAQAPSGKILIVNIPKVFFNEKWAQFMTRSHISTGSLNKIDHLEVIGNIYENPELLK